MVVNHYKESEEYTTEKLLNALGGALSLVMGLTLFTAMEFAELILDLITDILHC